MNLDSKRQQINNNTPAMDPTYRPSSAPLKLHKSKRRDRILLLSATVSGGRGEEIERFGGRGLGELGTGVGRGVSGNGREGRRVEIDSYESEDPFPEGINKKGEREDERGGMVVKRA